MWPESSLGWSRALAEAGYRGQLAGAEGRDGGCCSGVHVCAGRRELRFGRRRHRPRGAAAASGAAGLQRFAPRGVLHRAKPRSSRCCPGAPASPDPAAPGRPTTDLPTRSLSPNVGPEWEASAPLHPGRCGDMCDAGARNLCRRNKSLSQSKCPNPQKQGGKRAAAPFGPPEVFAAACQMTPLRPPE